MSNDKELLQQMLEALDDAYCWPYAEIIKTIRDNLAEPKEAEPVAWCYPPDMEWLNEAQITSRSAPVWSKPIDHYKTPLYLHPPHPAVRLSAADILALKPDNEAIIDDQWLVRFAINIERDVLEKNGL